MISSLPRSERHKTVPRLWQVRGHALSTYAKRGRGGVLLLRTPLHKCDVTYVVRPAYKGGGGGSKSPEILRTYYVHAP